MEKVINLLYDIEEKANRIIDRANNEKSKLQKEHDEDLTRLDKQVMDETMKKLNSLQKEINEDLAKEKTELLNDYNKQIEHLDNYYTNNHDKLVQDVFDHIVGM